jgi:hypothetical protein
VSLKKINTLNNSSKNIKENKLFVKKSMGEITIIFKIEKKYSLG